MVHCHPNTLSIISAELSGSYRIKIAKSLQPKRLRADGSSGSLEAPSVTGYGTTAAGKYFGVFVNTPK
jgi:hypothetical protein